MKERNIYLPIPIPHYSRAALPSAGLYMLQNAPSGFLQAFHLVQAGKPGAESKKRTVTLRCSVVKLHLCAAGNLSNGWSKMRDPREFLHKRSLIKPSKENQPRSTQYFKFPT